MQKRRNPATRGVRYPFVVEHLVTARRGGRDTSRKVWGEIKTLPTLEMAQEHVWAQLSTTGGSWRVRRGKRVLVQGAGLTPAERADTGFWIDWARDASITLGALLADTIGRPPSTNDTIHSCTNQLIDVEQQLSALMSIAAPKGP